MHCFPLLTVVQQNNYILLDSRGSSIPKTAGNCSFYLIDALYRIDATLNHDSKDTAQMMKKQ